MKTILIFLIPFLYGCNKSGIIINSKTENDTIIIKKSVPSEIAVFPNEKECFAVVKQDTLNFSCIFSKIDDSNVFLNIENIRYKNISLKDSSALGEDVKGYPNKISYKEKMKILSLILKEADKEFNLKKIHSINFGELINYNDLAIEITNTYTKKFQNKISNDYFHIHQVLQNSMLKKDLNNILKPYFISIKEIGIENLFFVDKKDLFIKKGMGTSSIKIPDKILNGFIYIKLTYKK